MNYDEEDRDIIEVKHKSNKCTSIVSLFSILNFIFLCIIISKINYIDNESNKFFLNSKTVYDRMDAIDIKSMETSLSAISVLSAQLNPANPANPMELYMSIHDSLQALGRNITILGTQMSTISQLCSTPNPALCNFCN